VYTKEREGKAKVNCYNFLQDFVHYLPLLKQQAARYGSWFFPFSSKEASDMMNNLDKAILSHWTPQKQ
jgi:hypothetical protein